MSHQISDRLDLLPNNALIPLANRIGEHFASQYNDASMAELSDMLAKHCEAYGETTPIMEADLARELLRGASLRPDIAHEITLVSIEGPPESFGEVGGLLDLAAAITLLRISGYIEYEDGKWRFGIRLNPISPKLFADICAGLLRCLLRRSSGGTESVEPGQPEE